MDSYSKYNIYKEKLRDAVTALEELQDYSMSEALDVKITETLVEIYKELDYCDEHMYDDYN